MVEDKVAPQISGIGGKNPYNMLQNLINQQGKLLSSVYLKLRSNCNEFLVSTFAPAEADVKNAKTREETRTEIQAGTISH